jgi:predicted ATPase
MEILSGGARDAPARHRALSEAIAWSYELLDARQQRLFRRLSVFVGGCTIDGIEPIHDSRDVAAHLESLLDKHLVVVLEVSDGADPGPRYSQLETIREYAAVRLAAAGESDDAREHHARYLVGVVEALAPGLYGSAQRQSVQRLMAEHNNIRAALDWSLAAEDEACVELGLRLAGALWLFWRLRGFVVEGRRRLADLLHRAGVSFDGTDADLRPARPSRELAQALYAAGYLAFAQAAAEDADVLLSASLELARQVGDAWVESYALHGLGHAAMLRGN